MHILYEGKNIRKISIPEGIQNRHSESTIILKCLIIKDETKQQNEVRLGEVCLISLCKLEKQLVTCKMNEKQDVMQRLTRSYEF